MQAAFRGRTALARWAGMTNPLKRALGAIERRLDHGKVAAKSRLGLFRKPEVQIFRGHGTPARVRITGRVVEETGTRDVGADVGHLRTMLNTFRRMESDEMPGARLRVRACGAQAETTTDEEGFFALELACADVQPGWHHVEAELLSSPSGHAGVVGTGEVLVVAAECELGYVSDLDDTVIETGARNKLTHTRILLVRDALEQVAFPGVAEFYTLLTRGPDGATPLPVFYVSRSSWGLYDLFVDFMELHEIPRGPTFLMDAAVIEQQSTALGHTNHKLDTIREILEWHPRMQLVLIGDSGQHDPEAYLEVAQKYEERIRAVYLRDVTDDEARDAEVKAIVARIAAMGIPATSCATTTEMARHAEGLGLIPRGSAESIGR